MTEILIADDHSVVREGVKHILSDMPEVAVTEAGNGREVLNAIRKKDFDLILLDIAMPGKDGLDVLRDIKAEKPQIKVLMLSMFPEEQYALRAMKSGASGYLTKESIPEELIRAIRKILRGGKYLSAEFSDRVILSLDDGAEKPLHEKLSNREYQVLRMIASGKTISKISEELFLSVKTVSTYRSRVLEKMNLKNNAEIMHYAVRNKLVE